MAYPGNFLKLSWGGQSTKEDVWSNSISIRDEANPDHQGQLGSTIDLTAIFNKIADTYGGIAGMAKFCTLDYVKIAQIGTDGRYIGEARVYAPQNGVPGSADVYGRAPQDSLVLTLSTATRTGLARNGRVYLPAGFTGVSQTTGRTNNGDTKQILDKFAALLKFIETQGGGDHTTTVVVASGQGAGAFKSVVSVKVGDVLDTQRRRRNRIGENYQENVIRAV